MRHLTLGALLTVSLVTLTACAGTEQQSASEPSQANPSVEATETVEPSPSAREPSGSALFGTFETAVTANEFNTPIGDWQLAIDEGGVTFVQPDGFEFSPGDVESLTDSEIVFAPDPECPTQEVDATEGRYQWEIEGVELVISEVEDSCRDRAHLLTQAAWQIAP